MSSNIFEGYISREEYARQRGFSLRSEHKERARRAGPPFIKIGQKVYYSIAGIKDWLDTQTISTRKNK